MGHRTVFFDGAFGLLWILMCFMYLGTVGANILPISLGVLSGLVYGAVVALKYTRSIEKTGEFRNTPRILAFALLAITIVALIAIIAIYLFPTFSLDIVIQMTNFTYSIFPGFYVARTIVYANWERKNARRILFDSIWIVTRVYAVPELRGRP